MFFSGVEEVRKAMPRYSIMNRVKTKIKSGGMTEKERSSVILTVLRCL
jgi:hypothetical protein